MIEVRALKPIEDVDSPTASRLLSLFVVPGGAALLAYLLLALDLRLGLAVAVPAMAIGFHLVWCRLSPGERGVLRSRFAVGAGAGLIATVAYDSSKFLLARLAGTAENPFGAVPKFGALVLGDGAGDLAHVLAGAALHVTNGVTFGLAFAVLFTRPTWLKGIAFGLFLELFQLALYPGWLNPQSYAEFASLSAFGHVVYGVSLGATTSALGARVALREVT